MSKKFQVNPSYNLKVVPQKRIFSSYGNLEAIKIDRSNWVEIFYTYSQQDYEYNPKI